MSADQGSARPSSAVVFEWGCPSCGGVFVVTQDQRTTHYALCVPEDDRDECEELDGCCLTHGPCFHEINEYVDDGSACEGWPCSKDSPRPERGNSGMCDKCLRVCSHDYAPCPFCSPCEHVAPAPVDKDS